MNARELYEWLGENSARDDAVCLQPVSPEGLPLATQQVFSVRRVMRAVSEGSDVVIISAERIGGEDGGRTSS